MSNDRQTIVGATGAVNFHQQLRMLHTKGHQDPHVCGLGEERQASRDGEYDLSERINAWHARESGGIVGDRHLVEVTWGF
jgi:hypothetical protein